MTLKFWFDRIFALAGLILCSWFLLLIGLMVRIVDGVPVFFLQQRVGMQGKLFVIHKFRTMSNGARGTSITVKGDRRVTKLGAFLRRYKLDELPELWDVLVGNMSFVGPRPDVPGYADRLVGADREILHLLPGITGPATLKYRNEEELLANEENPQQYHDEVVYPDKVRLNRYYLHHYSFWMDIKIIFATLFGKKVLFNGEYV